MYINFKDNSNFSLIKSEIQPALDEYEVKLKMKYIKKMQRL